MKIPCLDKEVTEIINEIEILTGKSVEIIHAPNLIVSAILKAARENMNKHIIYYKYNSEILNYLVLHECGHLIRMFSVPKSERLIPIFDVKAEVTFIQDTGIKLGFLTSTLRDATIYPLLNYPVDLIIEKWIAIFFPKMRCQQLKFQKFYFQEIISMLEILESGKLFPSTYNPLFTAIRTLNYAYFWLLGFILRENFTKHITVYIPTRQAKELCKIIEETNSSNYIEDRKLIHQLSNHLNINGWWSWTDFENIPPNYETSIPISQFTKTF